jgi:two-component system, chemotaxis family, chemotaxis protein CheY
MEPSSRSLATPAEATPASPRALRILYADDLHELRDLARISLTRDGHGIECFADGALALAEIEADSEFDLVITDHHMPNMNGLEFVMNLRGRAFSGKIMVFSSELSETVARQYREHKVDRILYKPVFPSALRKILSELFPAEPQAA